MTFLEVYCDICDACAPSHAQIGGFGAGQAIRELYPKLHKELHRIGWERSPDGDDLCPDCVHDVRGITAKKRAEGCIVTPAFDHDGTRLAERPLVDTESQSEQPTEDQ